MKRNKSLTRRGFINWLTSKEPNEEVAPTGYMAWSCPLANFMQYKTNQNYVMTTSGFRLNDLTSKNGEYEYETPDWASKFIYEVDTLSDKYDSYRQARAVTAEEALKIVNKTL